MAVHDIYSDIMVWFGKDEIIGSKVLVCSIGNHFEPLVTSDGAIYAQFYSGTIKAIFATTSDLTAAIIRQRYDIVHLCCDISKSGVLQDGAGNVTTTGTELIQICCDAGVKLLWMASDNHADCYINGFQARRKRINLVMTINRKDPYFLKFLDKLLFRMSCGNRMPVAWADLWPQIPTRDSVDPNFPSLIFYAGRGGVKLR